MATKLGKFESKQPIQGIPIASTIISKNPISWSEDNKISVTTTHGVCIFDLIMGPYGNQAGLPFDRVYILPPKSQNPYILSGEKLQSLLKSVATDECHKFTLDATLTAAHRAKIEIVNSRPNKNGIGYTLGVDMNHLAYSKVAWSYKGATQRDECILCLVTFDHQITIVGKVGSRWITLCDLTSLWANYITYQGKTIYDEYQNSIGKTEFHKFLAKTQIQGVAAVLWTPFERNSDGEKDCILLMATTSSHLVLVRIPQYIYDHEFTPQIMECFRLNSSGKILALEWIRLSSNGGLVSLGTVDGQIEIYSLSLKPNMYVKHLHSFENSTFGMHVNHLRFVCMNKMKDQYMLVVAKQNILFAYLLIASSSGVKEVASTYAMLGCFQISGLKIIEPDLVYVSVKDGEIKCIHINFSFKTKEITFSKKETFFSSKGKVFYNGFCFSPNDTLFAILECVSVPHDHLALREPTAVNLFQVDPFECALLYVMEEESKTLSDHIDVFESIRLLTYRDDAPIFPPICIADISSLSNYKRKVYMFLTIIEMGVMKRKGATEDDLKEKENLLSMLESSILIDHIKNVFSSCTKESFPVDDEDHKLSLHLMCLYMEEKGEDHPYMQSIKDQLGKKKGENTEICIICNTATKFSSGTIALCCKGSKVPRCLRTLLPTPPVLRCINCNLFYHPNASKWFGEEGMKCLICSRILQSRINRKSAGFSVP